MGFKDNKQNCPENQGQKTRTDTPSFALIF